MLRIWFGHDYPEKYVKIATGIVSGRLKTSDFTDKFTRQMIKAIDNVDTDEEGRMYHPIFGAINQSKLSNGVSQLIMLYKLDLVGDITHMGDNCLPFLRMIAEKKDVTCVCNRMPVFDTDFDFYDIRHNAQYTTRKKLAQLALYQMATEADIAMGRGVNEQS